MGSKAACAAQNEMRSHDGHGEREDTSECAVKLRRAVLLQVAEVVERDPDLTHIPANEGTCV